MNILPENSVFAISCLLKDKCPQGQSGGAPVEKKNLPSFVDLFGGLIGEGLVQDVNAAFYGIRLTNIMPDDCAAGNADEISSPGAGVALQTGIEMDGDKSSVAAIAGEFMGSDSGLSTEDAQGHQQNITGILSDVVAASYGSKQSETIQEIASQAILAGLSRSMDESDAFYKLTGSFKGSAGLSDSVWPSMPLSAARAFPEFSQRQNLTGVSETNPMNQPDATSAGLELLDSGLVSWPAEHLDCQEKTRQTSGIDVNRIGEHLNVRSVGLFYGEESRQTSQIFSQDRIVQLQAIAAEAGASIHHSKTESGDFDPGIGETSRPAQSDGNRSGSPARHNPDNVDQRENFVDRVGGKPQLTQESADGSDQAIAAKENQIPVSSVPDRPASAGTVPKTPIAPVKFIMPPDIGSKNVNTSRTIIIKMEPDGLGTIRLALSSSGEGIKGRMVVDNPRTLAVVKSNIDNLISNITEKGIRLDAFEVAVGGGQTGGELGRGRVLNGSRNRSIRSYTSKDRGISGINTTHPAGMATYINSSGVNWLA
jgi:hypothetical protein